MKRIVFMIAMLLFLVSQALAAHVETERYYQVAWCAEHGGTLEYVLSDRARVDCLTEEYAIEFDFASKWAEAIGQALYYALMTGKKPGVVLIMEKPSDKRQLKRLEAVAKWNNIKVWIVERSNP